MFFFILLCEVHCHLHVHINWGSWRFWEVFFFFFLNKCTLNKGIVSSLYQWNFDTLKEELNVFIPYKLESSFVTFSIRLNTTSTSLLPPRQPYQTIPNISTTSFNNGEKANRLLVSILANKNSKLSRTHFGATKKECSSVKSVSKIRN